MLERAFSYGVMTIAVYVSDNCQKYTRQLSETFMAVAVNLIKPLSYNM